MRAREAVTRLQSGDEAALAAWQRICDASRKEFNAIYSRLGIKLDEVRDGGCGFRGGGGQGRTAGRAYGSRSLLHGGFGSPQG